MDCNDDISPGGRVYEIREALGSKRRPLAQDAFAERLTAVGRGRYHGPEISLIERGMKPLTLDDVATIASLDPLKRGKVWLACWEDEQETPTGLPAGAIIRGHNTEEEAKADAIQAEKDRAARAAKDPQEQQKAEGEQ